MSTVRTKWRDIFKRPLQPTFLNIEKDIEQICNLLFLESKEFSDYLKRLLIIQSPDCLDNLTNEKYKEAVNKATLASLKKDGYLRIVPKIKLKEHEDVKSFLVITFDNFSPDATNGYYRDGQIMIDIICHMEQWDLGGFKLRPYLIAGYIDAILNNTKLSGLGKLQFAGCDQLILNEDLGGLCLIYNTVHGADDYIPNEEDEDVDE